MRFYCAELRVSPTVVRSEELPLLLSLLLLIELGLIESGDTEQSCEMSLGLVVLGSQF